MRKNVLNGGAAVLTRQLVSFPLNLAGVFLASRLLLPSDFGVQAVLLPVISFVVVFADLGTSRALVQSNAPADKTLLRYVQLLKLVGAFISGFFLVLISKRLIFTFGIASTYLWLFPAASILGWLSSQRNFLAVNLQRQIDWPKLVRIEAGEIIVYNFVLVVTAYFFRNAWCFLFALGTRFIFGSFFLYLANIASKASIELNPCSPKPTLKSLVRFGVPLQTSELFGLFNSFVNPVVVGGFVGIHAVGLVNWSNYVISLPLLPIQSLPNFLFSVLSERRRQSQDDYEILSSLAFVGMVGLSIISLIITLPINWLIHNVFGDQWNEATAIIWILSLSNVISFPTLVLVAQLTAKGHSMIWLLANILGTVLLWALVSLFVTLFEAEGFAIGWVIASFIPLALLSVYACRNEGLFISWVDTLYILLVMIISLMTNYLLSRGGVSGMLQTMQNLTIGTLIYLAILFPLLYLRRQKFLLLWNMILPKKAVQQ